MAVDTESNSCRPQRSFTFCTFLVVSADSDSSSILRLFHCLNRSYLIVDENLVLRISLPLISCITRQTYVGLFWCPSLIVRSDPEFAEKRLNIVWGLAEIKWLPHFIIAYFSPLISWKSSNPSSLFCEFHTTVGHAHMQINGRQVPGYAGSKLIHLNISLRLYIGGISLL